MDAQQKKPSVVETKPTSSAANSGDKPPYNTQPAGLEGWMDNVLNKKAPFQFPDGLKTWLSVNAWWLALIGAILSAFGAVGAYSALNAANSILGAYNMAVYPSVTTNAVYLSILTSVVSAVLLFMAFNKLKVFQKAGWNLLYYSFLLGLVVNVVNIVLFPSYAGIVGQLLGFMLSFLIGGYVLFQIRSHFDK